MCLDVRRNVRHAVMTSSGRTRMAGGAFLSTVTTSHIPIDPADE
jgi:hypothetical protein